MRQPTNEIDLIMPTHDFATGVWSNRTTLWVADILNPATALRLPVIQREPGNRHCDIAIAVSSDLGDINIWSDGSTIWVSRQALKAAPKKFWPTA